MTYNDAASKAHDFTRTVEAPTGPHHRIRRYTPRHNGKVERCNRLLADEVLSARHHASEQARRIAIGPWDKTLQPPSAPTAYGDQPPVSRTPVPHQ